MPDWKSPATLEKLIAALIAANNGKVDNQAVARYMDETYDAVENRTRAYKKEAQKLAKEAEQAGRMEMDMRKRGGNTSPRKPRTATPKKTAAAAGDLHGVSSGRVSKSPSKKKAAAAAAVIKQEIINTDADIFGHVNNPAIAAASATTGASFAFEDMHFSNNSFPTGDLVGDWDSGIA